MQKVISQGTNAVAYLASTSVKKKKFNTIDFWPEIWATSSFSRSFWRPFIFRRYLHRYL